MKRVSAAEFEAHPRDFLAAAQRGEEVVVIESGHPIARLSGLDSDDSDVRRDSRGSGTAPAGAQGMRRQRHISSEPSDHRSRLLDVLLRGPDRDR